MYLFYIVLFFYSQKMKLTFLLCLIAVVNVALAKKKGGLLDKLFNKNKNTKPKDNFKSNPNLYNRGGSVHKQDIPGSHPNTRPQQPIPSARGYPGHGGYPAQGGYPGQGQYPARGGYPGQGQYPAQGGYAGHGGYINQNPNNHILSPHYGSSYGGYAPGRGSPYSRTVEAMGYVPSEKSKGFGRSAMMAGAGGALAGMALGYGLGSFPRPHFNFHSPEEENYYNYYMYRRYGLKSPDGSDFRRDFTSPPENYEQFMSLCMRKIDLLPSPKKSQSRSHYTDGHEDDDTVSVVEIGYPALIKQLKVRKCLGLYIHYSENKLRKKTTQSPRGGGQRWESPPRLLLVLTIVILIMAQ
uniref:Prion protein, related sequence 3 n=1 Tax=Neogobius melanostomus TaxID=47308 RepID=A0A8C6T6C7_9GOBI